MTEYHYSKDMPRKFSWGKILFVIIVLGSIAIIASLSGCNKRLTNPQKFDKLKLECDIAKDPAPNDKCREWFPPAPQKVKTETKYVKGATVTKKVHDTVTVEGKERVRTITHTVVRTDTVHRIDTVETIDQYAMKQMQNEVIAANTATRDVEAKYESKSKSLKIYRNWTYILWGVVALLLLFIIAFIWALKKGKI